MLMVSTMTPTWRMASPPLLNYHIHKLTLDVVLHFSSTAQLWYTQAHTWCGPALLLHCSSMIYTSSHLMWSCTSPPLLNYDIHKLTLDVVLHFSSTAQLDIHKLTLDVVLHFSSTAQLWYTQAHTWCGPALLLHCSTRYTQAHTWVVLHFSSTAQLWYTQAHTWCGPALLLHCSTMIYTSSHLMWSCTSPPLLNYDIHKLTLDVVLHFSTTAQL